MDTGNYVIRRVSTSGIITTIAGTGVAGYLGDNGAATSAKLLSPVEGIVDSFNNIVFGEYINCVVRKISSTGIITTIAGIGGYCSYSGDKGVATSAALNNPYGVAVDVLGNLYIADSGNHCIRKVSTDSIITTIAGNGMVGYSGDLSAATSALLGYSSDVYVHSSGQIIIVDTGNCVLRIISTDSIINTIAGIGQCGYAGDGGSPTSAELLKPYGVVVDASGYVIIADSSHTIRKFNYFK